MEALTNKIISHLQEKYNHEPTFIPEDLREIKRFLGTFRLNMYNWRMEKVRKTSIMRCTVKIPSLDVFAIQMYPEPDYDLPLLAIDFSCMKKKSFVYINFIPLFSDKDYHDKYIARLQPVYEQYNIVKKDKPKEWMVPYFFDYTVYAMLENSMLENAVECAWAYISCYLDMVDSAEKITDTAYREKVASVTRHYLDLLSEKDGSRQMLGKFTGMEKANRIFQEVIR